MNTLKDLNYFVLKCHFVLKLRRAKNSLSDKMTLCFSDANSKADLLQK